MTDAATATNFRRLIKEIDRALDRVYRRVSKNLRLGIGHTELAMLIELYNEDNQQPSKLSARIGHFTTSYSPPIDRLVKAGLVIRQKNPEDRRKHIIALTDKAKALEPEVMRRLDLFSSEDVILLNEGEMVLACIERLEAIITR